MQAVARLQIGQSGDERLGGVAGDQRDVGDRNLGQVAQDDVEDGQLAVDRQQRLGQRIGVRSQALTLARGENESDHDMPFLVLLAPAWGGACVATSPTPGGVGVLRSWRSRLSNVGTAP